MTQKKLLNMIADLIDMLKKKEHEIDYLKSNQSMEIFPRRRNQGPLTFGHGYDRQNADVPTPKNRSKKTALSSHKKRNKN